MSIHIEDEQKDIQALLLTGYGRLSSATYLLLKIEKTYNAKEYLNGFLKRYPTVGADTNNKSYTDAVNIAFTAKGLFKLGMPVDILKSFSREFVEDMNFTASKSGASKNERQIILGDTGLNDPAKWHWGNCNNPIDCLMLFYSQTQESLNKLVQEVFHHHNQGAFEVVYTAATLDGELTKEHFGFADGISQPIIRDFKSPSENTSNSSNNIVNAGEFILGYKNEYNNYSPSPFFTSSIPNKYNLPFLPDDSGKINLGYNGSYLVFRQMEQLVEEFWKYQYEHSSEAGETCEEKAIKLAAKMVGRWPNGNPLVSDNDGSNSQCINQNDFDYATTDREGYKCPYGSHIRRTNPRDNVHIVNDRKTSVEMSNRHRLLRRGRIYGKPLAEGFDIGSMIKESINYESEPSDEIRRGLHFICLVSDIQRQFEFVQNVWCNTPTFAELTDETDPIISPRQLSDGATVDKFTVPHCPLRNRYHSVPQFVRIVGGSYFFLPGLRALKTICDY